MSIEVIGTGVERCDVHDILVAIHFLDKRRFQSKYVNFPLPPPSAYLTLPPRGFPLEFCNGSGALKATILPLPDDGENSFVIWLCAFVASRDAMHHLRYASPHLWNQLPVSFRQPCTKHPADDVTLSYSPPTYSPLSPSITHSLFHSRLKIHLFHKSFPP